MAEPASGEPSTVKTKAGPFIITFLASFGLWLILSGKFDYFHMSLGLISCALVSMFSGDLLFPQGVPKGFLVKALGVVGYLPWLLYQIFLANLHVLYLSIHPKMLEKINPQVIRFQSKLKSDISMVTFANSITLTPGTITLSVSVDGEFKVHAIDDKSAEDLPGQMEKRIARAFRED
ncbi:MAG: protein MnhE [Deltaproteobacteria bacterium]|nr:MAG: protein MnhE [Deltaproteobacteria bacterium]